MIIDSHVYTFEPADSPNGYSSGREHMAVCAGLLCKAPSTGVSAA